MGTAPQQNELPLIDWEQLESTRGLTVLRVAVPVREVGFLLLQAPRNAVDQLVRFRDESLTAGDAKVLRYETVQQSAVAGDSAQDLLVS